MKLRVVLQVLMRSPSQRHVLSSLGSCAIATQVLLFAFCLNPKTRSRLPLRLLLCPLGLHTAKDHFAAKGKPTVVTMAYYPDTRQEQLLKEYKISERADLMHMMSYDQSGQHHSTMEFGKRCVDQGVEVLPPERITVGLPFYGRQIRSGDWTTYEDAAHLWGLGPA